MNRTPDMLINLFPNVTFDGAAYVGREVSIGKDSVIGKFCYLLDQVQIGSNSLLQHGNKIGARSIIGDGTRIGEKSHVGTGTKIGNGCVIHENVIVESVVEIGDGVVIESDTTIKTGARIGRHCRIGESVTIDNALLESDITIGNKTIIGQAYIGSHCRIDNDVRIDNGAIIGSHCIIHDHVHLHQKAWLGDFCRLASKSSVLAHGIIAANSSIAREHDVHWSMVIFQPSELPLTCYQSQHGRMVMLSCGGAVRCCHALDELIMLAKHDLSTGHPLHHILEFCKDHAPRDAEKDADELTVANLKWHV